MILTDHFFIFSKDFIYVFERVRARVSGGEEQRESGEPAGGAGVTAWAEGSRLTAWATQAPQ